MQEKPRLRSIENILKTNAFGEKTTIPQVEAVYEESMEIIRSALNGDRGMLPMDVPYLCAAMRILTDELQREMSALELEAFENAYNYMRIHYQFER